MVETRKTFIDPNIFRILLVLYFKNITDIKDSLESS